MTVPVENHEFTILASGARTASVTTEWFENRYAKGIRLQASVTAAAGTSPTLDIKLQVRNPAGGAAFDMPGAAFAQITDADGDQDLVIYPGVAETANVSVSDALPRQWRLVCTQAGTSDSFTYSVGGCYIL